MPGGRTAARSGRGRGAASFGFREDADRGAGEVELLPQIVLEIPQVRCSDLLRVLAEEDERGRFGGDLGNIRRFDGLPLADWQRARRNRVLEDPGELRRRHAVREGLEGPVDERKDARDGLELEG